MHTSYSPPRAGAPDPARQAWLAILARASRASLEQGLRAALSDFDSSANSTADITQGELKLPPYDWLRAPETGLAMVRGRAGGTGDAFNLGEATVTRATLRLRAAADRPATVGIAYQLGRDKRRAELAALCDALLQTPSHHDAVQRTVIAPLTEQFAAERRQRESAAAATRVEFFTMVRGD